MLIRFFAMIMLLTLNSAAAAMAPTQKSWKNTLTLSYPCDGAQFEWEKPAQDFVKHVSETLPIPAAGMRYKNSALACVGVVFEIDKHFYYRYIALPYLFLSSLADLFI